MFFIIENLDIPFVEAYLDPSSYKAFHRLVQNDCTQFPNYDMEKLDFCKEAAIENHFSTLKKAHELGFHLHHDIVSLVLKNSRNKDIIQYILEQGCDVSCSLEKVTICNDVDILRLLYPHLHCKEVTLQCLCNAAEQDNISMLEFLSPLVKKDIQLYLNEFIGLSILSTQTFTFLRTHHKNLFRKGDYDFVLWNAIRFNNIELMQLVLDHMEEDIDPKRFEDANDLEVIKYIMENILWKPHEYSYLLCRYSNTTLEIVKYMLSFKYIDKDGYVTQEITTQKVILDNNVWCSLAECKDALELFTFLEDNDEQHFRFNGQVMLSAINNNRLDLVKFLYKKKCPWPDKQNDAAKRNYYSLLKFIHEHGCPCDGSCHKYYHANRIPFCS